MDSQPGMAASSLRSSMDGAVQLSMDGREPAASSGEPAPRVSRRGSLRMSSDGGLPGTSSHHSSLRNSSDGGLPPLRSWRGSLQNSCDSGLPFVASRQDSGPNSTDVASQPVNAADAGILMHRLSNLSSAVRSEGFEDLDDREDELSQADSSGSSDGFQDTCAKDLASDDLEEDGQPLASPTNQFRDFSFKNYGLLAEHNMEALRAEFAEAHAEKGNASSSADEHTSVH